MRDVEEIVGVGNEQRNVVPRDAQFGLGVDDRAVIEMTVFNDENDAGSPLGGDLARRAAACDSVSHDAEPAGEALILLVRPRRSSMRTRASNSIRLNGFVR